MVTGGSTVRMAQAIKDDEAKRKKCFACQSPDHFIWGLSGSKKWQGAPAAEGASQKQTGSSGTQGEGVTLSAQSAGAGSSTSDSSPKHPRKLKKGTQKVPCLNPDPFKHFIGPKELGGSYPGWRASNLPPG